MQWHSVLDVTRSRPLVFTNALEPQFLNFKPYHGDVLFNLYVNSMLQPLWVLNKFLEITHFSLSDYILISKSVRVTMTQNKLKPNSYYQKTNKTLSYVNTIF